MATIIHYTQCPVCDSTALKTVLRAKDHTVSGEEFVIEECNHCSFRFTQDVPDENSIAPYYQSSDYISHSNTAKGLINRLYHFVRKKTLVQKRALVQKVTGMQTGRILDAGCGIGSFVHEMKTAGWDTWGIEPDEGARKVAKEIYSLDIESPAIFYQLTAESFDAITLWHVLEHVHTLDNYISQLKAILKKEGRIIIAVPNYTAKDAAIYKESWAAYDVPRHLYHFSPRAMEALMSKHGLKIEQYKPMWFDSFYISMLSSKYKNGITNLPAAFWNGLRSNLAAISDAKKCSSVIYIIRK
jgi:2-polyprenyl-3-methyl-5-hydroxy-6-metoxy-1,4-benzoquinol methylase